MKKTYSDISFWKEERMKGTDLECCISGAGRKKPGNNNPQKVDNGKWQPEDLSFYCWVWELTSQEFLQGMWVGSPSLGRVGAGPEAASAARKSRSGCPEDPGNEELHEWAVNFCVFTVCHMGTGDSLPTNWQVWKFPKKHRMGWVTHSLYSIAAKQSNKDQQHWYPCVLLPVKHVLALHENQFIILTDLL